MFWRSSLAELFMLGRCPPRRLTARSATGPIVAPLSSLRIDRARRRYRSVCWRGDLDVDRSSTFQRCSHSLVLSEAAPRQVDLPVSVPLMPQLSVVLLMPS